MCHPSALVKVETAKGSKSCYNTGENSDDPFIWRAYENCSVNQKGCSKDTFMIVIQSAFEMIWDNLSYTDWFLIVCTTSLGMRIRGNYNITRHHQGKRKQCLQVKYSTWGIAVWPNCSCRCTNSNSGGAWAQQACHKFLSYRAVVLQWSCTSSNAGWTCAKKRRPLGNASIPSTTTDVFEERGFFCSCSPGLR